MSIVEGFTSDIHASINRYPDLVVWRRLEGGEVENMGPEGDVCETIQTFFHKHMMQHPDHVALMHEQKGQWSMRQWYEDTMRTGRAFYRLGLTRLRGVSIIGFNSPEWHLAFLGSIFAGGYGVGIYPTNNSEACRYVMEDSFSEFVVTLDKKQTEKIASKIHQLPLIKAIVEVGDEIDESVRQSVTAAGRADVKLLTWNQFLEEYGKEEGDDSGLEDRITQLNPFECASIVFTSGTTGKPKGVMLSHEAMTHMAGAVRDLSPALQRGAQERTVSFLPLSHILAQLQDIVVPLTGVLTVYFARPDALKGSLGETLKWSEPTVMGGVPRVFEKIQAQIEAGIINQPGLMRFVIRTAMSTCLAGNEALMRGEAPPWGWSLSRAIMHRLKQKVGLQHEPMLLCGGAPLLEDTHNFWLKIDCPLLQAYGLSESTGPPIIQRLYHEEFALGNYIIGSSGRPINKRTFVMIDLTPMQTRKMATFKHLNDHNGDTTKQATSKDQDNAQSTPESNEDTSHAVTPTVNKEGRGVIAALNGEEGEILLGGRCMFMGYINKPEDTKEVWVRDSETGQWWFRTGDLGRMDEKGNVYITGRLKELIITAGGENIPPVPIENAIESQANDIISNVMVVGDNRKYLVCLITIKCKLDEIYPTDELPAFTIRQLEKSGIKGISTVTEARKHPEILKSIQEAINAYNKEATSTAQRIQKFEILEQDFSIPGGEVGPTLKLKRQDITKKYADLINKMYEE